MTTALKKWLNSFKYFELASLLALDLSFVLGLGLILGLLVIAVVTLMVVLALVGIIILFSCNANCSNSSRFKLVRSS